MSARAETHKRKNLLTGEWVLVSPNRSERPWQGLLENPDLANIPSYDSQCYLCPGNSRANGQTNPDFRGPFSFENDYPALSESVSSASISHPMFEISTESGSCKVICYSHRHDFHLVDMSAEEISDVLQFIALEFQKLDERSDIAYVQVFENRGQMMGCSNPHPHAQVWATSGIPDEPQKECKQQQQYFDSNKSSLLMDYLAAELEEGSRVTFSNELAVAMVPFWASWPFETLIMPSKPVQGPADMTKQDWQGFAQVLRQSLQAYDRLFNTPMPYSMGFHARPSDGKSHPEWQFHLHIYPPLLRSATIRKHMVGFEMLGMPQRDLTAEEAATRLRATANEDLKNE